jgi:hypothetical protein
VAALTGARPGPQAEAAAKQATAAQAPDAGISNAQVGARKSVELSVALLVELPVALPLLKSDAIAAQVRYFARVAAAKATPAALVASPTGQLAYPAQLPTPALTAHTYAGAAAAAARPPPTAGAAAYRAAAAQQQYPVGGVKPNPTYGIAAAAVRAGGGGAPRGPVGQPGFTLGNQPVVRCRETTSPLELEFEINDFPQQARVAVGGAVIFTPPPLFVLHGGPRVKDTGRVSVTGSAASRCDGRSRTRRQCSRSTRPQVRAPPPQPTERASNRPPARPPARPPGRPVDQSTGGPALSQPRYPRACSGGPQRRARPGDRLSCRLSRGLGRRLS